MARSRQRSLVLAFWATTAVAAVLILAGIGSRRLFETKPSPTPLAARASRSLFPQADPGRFRVTGVQGVVECVQDGRTYALQPGDFLSLQDIIRTAAQARVLVRRGGSEIEILQNLEIRVDALAKQTARFSVLSGDGNMSASVEGKEETLAIAADATESINMGPSRWVVARAESGQVAVAVSEGQVRFKAQGEAVMLKSGTESVAAPGAPPGPPREIPEDLLLSVIWPETPPTKDTAKIQGTARPSSQVVINGRKVQVDADGTFSAEIPIKLGANKVHVREQDMQGRQKDITGTVKREATAPALEVKQEDLWTP